MNVETFEINEHLEDHLEVNEEQKRLIEELGLSGQEELIGKSKVGMICPYAEVTEEQGFIIKSVCPKRYLVKDYKRMQIPLRILQVISHCQQEEYFQNLYIFDKREEQIKDPFLLGCTNEYYNGKYFLLGRWGEELLSWRELRKVADKIEKDRMTKFIEDGKRKLDTFLYDGGEFDLSYRKTQLQMWD